MHIGCVFELFKEYYKDVCKVMETDTLVTAFWGDKKIILLSLCDTPMSKWGSKFYFVLSLIVKNLRYDIILP